jgi:WD40 repeat protein
VSTGRIQCVLEGHEELVTSIVFSPNSSLLTSASIDGTVRVWDVTTGKSLYVFFHGAKVYCIDFSPDGIAIASGSDYGELHVWMAASGKFQYNLNCHRARVQSLTFSPDSKLIASIAQDKEALIWQVETAQFIRIMHSFASSLSCVAFSPDRRLVALSSDSPEPPQLFDSGTGQLSGRLESVHTSHMWWKRCRLAFSPDCRLVARKAYVIAKRQGIVHVWNADTGKLRCTINISHDSESISFDATSTKIITSLGVFEVETAGNSPASPAYSTLLEPPATLLGPANSIGFGLSGPWITLDGANILWLPMKYRCLEDAEAAILGDRVILVCASVGLLFFLFDRLQLQYHGTS